MKRVLSLILAIVLMVSLIPSNLLTPHVHAEDHDEEMHQEEILPEDNGEIVPAAETATAVSVEMKTLPEKLTYLEQVDVLDTTGATLRVVFDDETEQVINVT